MNDRRTPGRPSCDGRSPLASLLRDAFVVLGLAVSVGPAFAQADEAPPAQPASRPASRPASSAPVGPEAARAQLTMIFEIDEHHLKVQEMWQIQNQGAGPLPAEALVFPLGSGTRRLSLDEEAEASFVANEAGTEVRAVAPVPPGGSASWAGSYLLDLEGASAHAVRSFPVPVGSGRVILEDVAGLDVTGSTPFSPRVRDLNGLTFRIFDFGGLPAGHRFELRIEGLPTRSTLPRNLAIALSVAAFAWMIVELARRRPTPAGARTLGSLAPEARRDQLLRALELLEEDWRAGRIEGKKHERRRKALVAELADVLREIDLGRGARSGKT